MCDTPKGYLRRAEFMHGKQRKSGARTGLLLTGLMALGVVDGSLAAQPQAAPKLPLIEAVKRGDVVAAGRLLDRGANPNAREVVLTVPSLVEGTEGGKPILANTALIIAVQKG